MQNAPGVLSIGLFVSRLATAIALLPVALISAGLDESLAALRSQDLRPHLESVGERRLLFVEGRPLFVLTAEVPWYQSHYGRYRDTMGGFDYLYPAAKKMHLNALKVTVKWSQVEPTKGVFDFTYVDHVKALAEANGLKLILGWFGHYASGSSGNIYRNLDNEVFAPMDIIEDEKTYPRAVDGDGRSYHAIISYDHDAVIEREAAAFRAFMRHIREIDAKTRTVIMIQVENEISVFNNTAARNPKMWRDHSPRSNELFKAGGYTADLRYSAERLASYRVGRNVVAISETNSDRSPLAPRLAFLAIGGYAAPLFSPWALNVSVDWGEPYVLKDGTLANGAFDLTRAYTAIERAAPAIALCAGTDKLKVFLDGESK